MILVIGPRFDAPGAKHHVMARGVGGCDLFLDDADRERFLRIAQRVFGEAGMRVYAWALMPNHVHWLVETGRLPLSRVFQRILGAYAQSFNRRHGRVGHLFQGRFASRLVTSDEYVATLIRYVHRNPLKAGLVRSLDELASYPWTGHRGMKTPRVAAPFHDVAAAFARLADDPLRAMDALDRLMASPEDEDAGFGASGLLRTSGRAEFEARSFGVQAIHCRDERLATIVAEMDSRAVRRTALLRLGWTPARVVAEVARRLRLDSESIRRGSRRGRVCRARAIVAHLACEHLGATRAAVAQATGVLPSAITHALRRAEGHARAAGIDPVHVLGL